MAFFKKKVIMEKIFWVQLLHSFNKKPFKLLIPGGNRKVTHT